MVVCHSPLQLPAEGTDRRSEARGLRFSKSTKSRQRRGGSELCPNPYRLRVHATSAGYFGITPAGISTPFSRAGCDRRRVSSVRCARTRGTRGGKESPLLKPTNEPKTSNNPTPLPPCDWVLQHIPPTSAVIATRVVDDKAPPTSPHSPTPRASLLLTNSSGANSSTDDQWQHDLRLCANAILAIDEQLFVEMRGLILE